MAGLIPGRIVLLGFLPWRDEARGVDVRENPAFVAATEAAVLLRLAGADAHAVGVEVEVSSGGVLAAVVEAERLGACVVVAAGQTQTEPRVERWGRVPAAVAPAAAGEATPWLLAPDAEALAGLVDAHAVAGAGTEPCLASDDAGGSFCDQLCVELVRLGRRLPVRARFVHLTAVDGCPTAVRDARVVQYARQLAAVARYLGATPAA